MPTPSWGLVTAAAHEHLVLLRNGTIVRAQQGGSVWKWPGDSVARIDTSVHRLQFTADQITRERVGVQVTGLAVFRVVAPLVAFRMLDLADPARHRAILEQMFVGATRRLVATLSLDDCLTRRKDALATELLAEVAPVVCGRGHPDDTADRGWGIAIDTIEIQDVRVLSAEVFERMQAPFRAELALSAVRAQAEVAAAEARAAAETDEASRALARSQADAAREHIRLETDARLADARRSAEAGVETARLEADARRLTAAAAADATRMERAAVDTISPARLQELALTQAAPELARALRGTFGEIVVRPADLAELAATVRSVLAP